MNGDYVSLRGNCINGVYIPVFRQVLNLIYRSSMLIHDSIWRGVKM